MSKVTEKAQHNRGDSRFRLATAFAESSAIALIEALYKALTVMLLREAADLLRHAPDTAWRIMDTPAKYTQ